MDFNRPQISLPIEKELIPYKIRQNIHHLSRDDLESMLIEMTGLLLKLTHQTHVLLSYISELEGKLSEIP